MRVLPGGHCFKCHADYYQDYLSHAHNFIKCSFEYGEVPTECTEKCKDSRYYTPDFAKIGVNKDGILVGKDNV